MKPSRRELLAATGGVLLTPGLGYAAEALALAGRFQQGGYAVGRTWVGAHIFIDGEALTTASSHGRFVVGFDRDAPVSTVIEARKGSRSARRTLDIAPGDFPTSRIDGLPPATVAPTDPLLMARIQREAVLKTEGFSSRIDTEDFAAGFDWPLETFRVSSQWGSQRVLNGTPARPHYGIDLAAPEGSPIRAPANGRVVLTHPDLHFEGGLVLIDHGQGLITAYLHQSAIDVVQQETVRRGQIIGRVGRTGRATGPHLCWRMKWRDRNLDPSLMVMAA